MKRLLVLAFIWGWSFLFIKVAVEGMTPPTVAFLRVALGATVLHIWLRHRGVVLPRDRATWASFLRVAVVGSVIPFTLLAWGEQRISSALTSVLNASTPLFTALAAAVVLGDRLTRRQAVGLLIGLAGVSIAAGLGAGDLGDSSLSGTLAATLAGAGYGLAFAWMRRDLITVAPSVAAAGQLTMATMLLAPFAAVTTVIDGFSLTPTRALAIVALGVAGTGLAYILNYQVIAELGATKASLVTYVIPVVAVVLGIVVLDEPFALRILVGGVLIAAGIAAVHGQARLPRAMPGAALLIVVAVVVAPLVACGGGGGAACGPALREVLDPGTAQHLLRGAPEPEYVSDPPTSGPHVVDVELEPVLDEPIPGSIQVGHLERGGVLLQHRDLPADELAELVELAGDGVVVAPKPDLDDPVVATAWLFKQSCDSVDPVALQQFVDEHRDSAPGTVREE